MLRQALPRRSSTLSGFLLVVGYPGFSSLTYSSLLLFTPSGWAIVFMFEARSSAAREKSTRMGHEEKNNELFQRGKGTKAKFYTTVFYHCGNFSTCGCRHVLFLGLVRPGL